MLTLSLGSLLWAVIDFTLVREQMLRDLRVLAEVVGENCVSALVFHSPETAERHLASLRLEYQIRGAELLDAEGHPFARWRRGLAPAAPDAAPDPAPDSALGGALPETARVDIEIVHPILFDGHPAGRLVLEVGLDELRRQMRAYLAFGALAALLTLGVALALALRLERRIAGPILDLALQSRALSAARDPTARLPDPDAGEEIATLVSGFNAVLAGLADREACLSRQTRLLDDANDKLRGLALDLAMLEETERARLAGALHDGPMQKLALAQIQIESSAREPDEETAEQLAAGIELLRESVGELRTLQFDLSPPVLERSGLSAALRWLAESTQGRYGVAMGFSLDGPLPPLDRAHGILAFQCARELVGNLVKHARASRGQIRLRLVEGCLELVVEDDGRGFAASHAARCGPAEGGYGLQGVCERIALVDGALSLEDLRPGARVCLRIPLPGQGAQRGFAVDRRV
jgi:signal transduction histidine kinase